MPYRRWPIDRSISIAQAHGRDRLRAFDEGVLSCSVGANLEFDRSN
jgi:hypothetical protein